MLTNPPSDPHAVAFVPLPHPACESARTLAKSLNLSVTFADLLHRRGYRDDKRTRDFLDPKLAHLTSPYNMLDRDVAIERICRAIQKREKIAIFADYDCDGITSAAIMTQGIEALGGSAHPHLANRFSGGYGLSEASVDKLLLTEPTLLITCDCGSGDHEQLYRLKHKGVDVVVIDHHLVPDEVLPAVAFLNPQRPECEFAYKNLASCGLSLSLVAGLRARLNAKLDVRQWLDLVAIGTIADMVPLDGDNRVLVRAGMRMLQNSARVGLQVLVELARVQLHAGVTSEIISFAIAPRLNAPGRLGDPMDALQLLLATDLAEARMYAAKVDSARAERRRIQEQMTLEAEAQVQERGWHKAPALVLAEETWHPGVVGIVAAHFVEQFGLPTVVIGFDGQVARGSVRGPKGVSVYDLLQACADVPIAFGGHHAAAGVTLDADKIDSFRERFVMAAERQLATKAAVTLPPAEVLFDSQDSALKVVDDLMWLEPCGIGNDAPLIGIQGATVVQSREVRGGHLQLQLQIQGGTILYGFGPKLGHWARSLKASDVVDAVGSMRRDTYRGGDAVGFNIVSLKTR